MADQGFLRVSGSDGDAPRVVTLSYNDQEMVLSGARGPSEWVAMSALRIRRDEGGQLVLGRRGARHWSLHLSGSAARNVRTMLPPAERRLTRLRRWAFRNPKLIGIAIAAPFFLVDHIPGRWLVPLTTPALAERLDQGVVTAVRRGHCNWPQGQRALDALVRRLEPDSVHVPRIVALPGNSFVVSAIPHNRILVYNSALTEAEPEVLAALVAHEIAHIRRGDVVRAIGRGEDSNYLWRLFAGPDEQELAESEYSAAEEGAADTDAIRMMRAAHITLTPAAAFFGRIDEANVAGRYWAQDYAAIHPGLPRRALAWADAAVGVTPVAFDRDQIDSLFNLCAYRSAGRVKSPI